MRSQLQLARRGFMFVELAIVVIIIAILAAIAMPSQCNFGHSRAVVSRAKADMRSLATAIESYYVDHKAYPAMRPLRETAKYPERLDKAGGGNLMTYETGRGPSLCGITTPISYIASPFPDPFTGKPPTRKHKSAKSYSTYAYYASPDLSGWILFSPGPDGDYDITAPAAIYDPAKQVPSDALIDITYDPTNGSASNGDVYRLKQ